MLKFLKYLLQLTISPSNGWDDISYAGTETPELLSSGFYPLLGVASLTAFCQMFYNGDTGVAEALQSAIIIFVQYFITYFLAVYLLPVTAGSCVDGEFNELKLTTFVAYSLGLMALVTIVQNLLPIDLAILNFMAIIVAVVMWKGCRYLAVKPESVGRFMILAVLEVIVPPILLSQLFTLFSNAS
jgi:hypothetical protein